MIALGLDYDQFGHPIGQKAQIKENQYEQQPIVEDSIQHIRREIYSNDTSPYAKHDYNSYTPT